MNDDLSADEQKKKQDLKATILRNMAEGVCLVGAADGIVVYANPKFESMFGYGTGELVGKAVSSLNHDTSSGKAEEVANALKGKSLDHDTYSYEVENVKKDGTPFWCRVTTSKFEHTVYGLVFVAIHEDITEKKEAQRRIEDSEVRYRSLFSSAYDSIVVVDSSGKILMANASTESIFGYEPNELIGKFVEILVPERFQQRHIADRTRYSSHPHSRPMGAGLELFGRRKDGKEFPVDISLSPFEVHGERHITAIVRDMTKRKITEVELRRLNREANAAVRTREEVLAVVSHDLKNPLSVILMCAQLLSTLHPADKQVRGQLEKLANSVGNSAQHMQRLISTILDFAKIQSGTFSVTPRNEKLRPIIETSIEAIRPIASAKAIHVAIEVEPEVALLFCDRDRLMQVFSNLLGNAVKFSPVGAVVSISAKKRGRDVVVSVADAGPGFQKDQLPHLFERYWQAKETARFGTGLGLAIAKGIVEAHKGRIWVESVPGQGSTFYFSLPAYATQRAMAG